MKIIEAKPYWAHIYMAGNLAEAERVCRQHCFAVGLCVTVTPTRYIYTGGEETGFIIGLINYPRFPVEESVLDKTAEDLAIKLMNELCQQSFTIQTPTNTRWFSRRPE